MPPLVRLIVNSDDFGLTPGVNRAVTELSAAGAVTSATLMASGSAFDHAVHLAATEPRLSVGCHVILTDGTPVAPPEQIKSLLQPEGNLRDSLIRFVIDLQRGTIRESDIEAEACAQIRRVQAAGITVTHVDTHKHTHLFPRVARPLLRAARACGVPAIRNPFEQPWSASLTRGALARRIEVAVLRNFQNTFHKLRSGASLKCTDGCIGVSATGVLDEASLRHLIEKAPAGTWELVCHPGYNDAALDGIKTRLRGTRDTEREALLKLIPAAVSDGRIELISFRDL